MPMDKDKDWKKGPCAIINIGCDGDMPHPHPKPDKECCSPCDQSDLKGGYTFVGSFDAGVLSPVGQILPEMLLVNPAGSGKNLMVTHRLASAMGSADEVALVGYSFDPAVLSSGSSVSIVNLNSSSSSLSVAKLYSVPSLSGFGTTIDAFSVSTPPYSSDEVLLIGEGHSLLVSFRANAENVRASASLYWTECKIHHEPEPVTG